MSDWTGEGTPIADEGIADLKNIVSLADLKAHCRVDGSADDALLIAYQLVACGEIRLMTDDPTIFSVTITDTLRLAALHQLQRLLVADLYDRRYATTAAVAQVRWSNHTLALADKLRSFRLLNS